MSKILTCPTVHLCHTILAKKNWPFVRAAENFGNSQESTHDHDGVLFQYSFHNFVKMRPHRECFPEYFLIVFGQGESPTLKIIFSIVGLAGHAVGYGFVDQEKSK